MTFSSAKKNLVFVVGLQLAFASLALAEDCQTEDCKKLSTQISSNLQQSADPCTDFYQYACGSWAASHPAPSDVPKYSEKNIMRDVVQQRLKALIEEEVKPNDPSAVKAAKEQYKACTNVEELNTKGLATLVNVLNELGGLPMATENFAPKKTWKEVHDLYLKKTGRGALYYFFVGPNTPRSTKNTLFLDQADYAGSEYETQEVGTDYVQFLTNVTLKIVEATGANVPKATIEAEAQKVLQFKIALEKIKNPDMYRKASDPLTLTAVDSSVENGTLNLLGTVKTLFNGIAGVTINGDVNVRVYELDYLRNLTKLIQNTDEKVLLNYLHQYFLSTYASYTTSEMNSYVNQMFLVAPKSRSTICVNEPNLQSVLNSMYVRRHSSPGERTQVTNLVHELKKTIEEQVKRTAWVSNYVQPAVAKLHNLAENIAYSDWYADVEAVNTYYAQYNMGSDILKNAMNYKEVNYKKQLSTLPETRNNTNDRVKSMASAPTSVNPNYKVRFNRLEVPAGDLQLPYYSVNSVPLANFAALGSQVAYLLYTLYDEFGIEYNDQGKPTSWFTPTDEYKAKLKCFDEQYKGYKIKELDDAGITYVMQPSIMLQTSMDSFGLKAALEAYEEKVKKGGADPTLPNLDSFSKQKQFFLAFANSFCETVNPREFRKMYTKLHVDTSRVRVNSAVSNLPKFSEVFNCPAGSPMNPPVKCSLMD